MKVLILDKVSLLVQSIYEADAPHQSNYGGPWGDPTRTVHVALPSGMDADCIEIDEVDGQYEITLNAEKVAFKAAQNAAANAKASLAAARAFGNQLIEDIILENMAMGITQDGMTGTVRKVTAEMISALSTGSLYDAMEEARLVPEDKKDAKYVTDARLLSAVNKIEAFLGIALSEEL